MLLSAGECFFVQHAELPAAIAVIYNQLPLEWTAYSDSGLVESAAIEYTRELNSKKIDVAANNAGGGGRPPNDISACGAGVMVIIGLLTCRGKGRHAGSSSSSSSSSSRPLSEYEQAERLLSRGEVNNDGTGTSTKRRKTARVPSRPHGPYPQGRIQVDCLGWQPCDILGPAEGHPGCFLVRLQGHTEVLVRRREQIYGDEKLKGG